jgi:membrane fusion protein, multidrug efflux system
MSRRSLPLLLLGIYLTLVSLVGCGHRPNLSQDDGPLGIEVSLPVQREVIDSEEFNGRLDAIFSLDVKPQVTGKLLTMPFAEGREVKKGELLFTIDPEQYQAQVDVGKADVELTKAKLFLAHADNVRAKAIRADNPAAISKQDLDKYDAQEKEAIAAVASSEAKLKSYEINLRWCKIPSDIDGVISKYYLTTGNLVNQNQTLLTTVVSVDPIYAYFDMDERTLLRVRDAIKGNKIKVTESDDILVYVGLTNEKGFPHKGLINFVNNKVDPNTGTILVRGKLDNPKIDDKGKRLMSPGMFARIQLPLSNPYPALLVADKVILTDQGLKNVYVVDAEKKVQYRRVTLGASQPDGMRVVTGLEKTDLVAVSNLQQLRPDMEVTFDVIPMESVAKSGPGK